MKQIVLVISLFISIGLFADGTQPTGAGTSGDPYQIATLDNLLWVSTNDTSWDSYFIQIADIDASDTQSWNRVDGFNPIGNGSIYFTGSYNGSSFIISDLYIFRPSTDAVGLFGVVYSGDVSNLGIENADIIGRNMVGVLAGAAYSTSTVSNCYSTGSVSGEGGYVGGLIGSVALTSIVSYSYNTASVSGQDMIGGLVGRNESYSTISYCYSIGSVSGIYFVGGLVGYNTNFGVVSDCYSTGTVYGYQMVGGLMGENSENSTVTQCYSAGSVSGFAIEFLGGLVGFINTQSVVNNSFWDIETSEQSTSYGGTGKTTVEMKTESTFTDAGWDFNTTWDISNYGVSYPFLRWYDTAPTGSTPKPPENIQISLVGQDAIITWDAVTESTDDYPMIVDGYIVLYSEDDIDYYYLSFTTSLEYEHFMVVEFRSQMFYNVLANKSYSTRQQTYLKELNNRKEKVKWSEVKQKLDKMETPAGKH